MKIPLPVLACALVLSAQNNPAVERKHISVPIENSAQPFGAAASEIERGSDYPSVIHLKGDVEVRMPVCIAAGPGAVQRCAGDIVLHADEIDLHEQSGQIDARGAVTVKRQ